jgi:hypothetical protein
VGPLSTLMAIASIGFPYGYDSKSGAVSSRGFVGNIAATRAGWDRFPGRPEIYELSFAAPVGLSGAPLIILDHRVCGVVVGNHQTKMLVFTDEERLEEGAVINRVERYEVLNLGIAVRARTILSLQLPDGQSLLDFVRAAGAAVHDRD